MISKTQTVSYKKTKRLNHFYIMVDLYFFVVQQTTALIQHKPSRKIVEDKVSQVQWMVIIGNGNSTQYPVARLWLRNEHVRSVATDHGMKVCRRNKKYPKSTAGDQAEPRRQEDQMTNGLQRDKTRNGRPTADS